MLIINAIIFFVTFPGCARCATTVLWATFLVDPGESIYRCYICKLMTAIDNRCYKPWIGSFPERTNPVLFSFYLTPVLLILVGIHAVFNILVPNDLGTLILLVLSIYWLSFCGGRVLKIFLNHSFHPSLSTDFMALKSIKRKDDLSMAADLTSHYHEIC